MLRLHLCQSSKSPHRPAPHREWLIKDVTLIQSCITFAYTYLSIKAHRVLFHDIDLSHLSGFSQVVVSQVLY